MATMGAHLIRAAAGRATAIAAAALIGSLAPAVAWSTDGPLDAAGCHYGGRPPRYHCHRGADAKRTEPTSERRDRERGWEPGGRSQQTETGYVVRVLRVPDGDTIHVKIDNRVEKVRYIGVATPEASHPEWRDADMWQAARRVNAQLVLGKRVVLELDAQKRDGLGRLLAYVWVDDVMVNAEMVRLGYATVVETANTRHQDLLARSERDAKELRRGLWSRDDVENAMARRRPPLDPADALAGAPTVPLPRRPGTPATAAADAPAAVPRAATAPLEPGGN